MPTVTDLACPTCAAGAVMERLTDTGSGYRCSKGHQFNDTGELLAMQPKLMPLPEKAPVRMLPGYVSMEIFVPANLKQALNAKFGKRVDATLVAICTTLLDPGAFVMSSEDVNQLKQYFGGKAVRHGAELLGEVFSIHKENADLKDQVKEKQSTSLVGSLVLRPSPETLAALRSTAEARKLTVSKIATDCLDSAAQNGWM